MSRKKKTHYVTLRLLFTEPQSRQEAVKAAGVLLKSNHATLLRTTDPATKQTTQRIAAFQVKRVC